MKVDGREFGPNMSRLIVHKISVDAVPSGGGVQSAIEFIMNGRLEKSAKEASVWALRAVEAVLAAPDYTGEKTEEGVAGMILQKLDERLNRQKKQLRGQR